MTTPQEDPNKAAVDSVLLIDGDNDPHFPPEFPLNNRTLVRVFVRTGAKMPRGLEKRLGDLPLCVAIVSPKGGANAADFVMSLHGGILHATLPMHIPFMLVTHDKSLGVMCQELQRVGRRAELWTSHPERGGRARNNRSSSSTAKPSTSRRGGRGRRKPQAAPPPATITPTPLPPVASRGIADVAAAYALRLTRIKDPPSRLKTLLNDIKNRAGATGVSPEDVLAELKRNEVLSVDANGRVALLRK